MSVKKRRVDDPSDTARRDLHHNLEERVFNDIPPQTPAASHLPDKPGKSIIEAALAARDTKLLRNIAAERKGLTDQQRRALSLVADLLDLAAARHSDSA